MYRIALSRFCKIINHQKMVFRGWSSSCDINNIVIQMKMMYFKNLLPLEEKYSFHEFHSPMLYDCDFDAKPMVLFVGKNACGKTTLINYLLGEEYPGAQTGPDSATDYFNAIMYSEQVKIIPGYAAARNNILPFQHLINFGETFLNHFQCCTLNNMGIRNITLIDTPGVGTGDKQLIKRGYDYLSALEWFGEKADVIVIIFDAHNVYISDELRHCVESFRMHTDKIRILLNKSDVIPRQQLVRVYGKLMWALGKIFDTPESVRVYVGTFWDNKLMYKDNEENIRFFAAEERDFIQDLQTLPYDAIKRKLYDLSRRAHAAKAHAYLMSHLRSKIPFLGKEKAKRRLIENLKDVYVEIELKHQVYYGTFPDLSLMQEMLAGFDWEKLQTLKPILIQQADELLVDIANIIHTLPDDTKIGDIEHISRTKFQTSGAYEGDETKKQN